MLEDLSIREVQPEDLLMILRWRNSPDVRKFMLSQHEITMEEHLDWYAHTSKDSTRRLLIVESSENGHLGYVQFSNVSVGGIADWGFYRAPEAPSGSGVKLGSAALTYAFEELQVHKVCGQALHRNSVSIAFHLRMGFVREGIVREPCRLDNTYYSLVCFGLLNQEWRLKQ